MRTPTNQDGITLLVTLLLMGVLLGISVSLMRITLKQYQLSGISNASERAFQAANAGMECALYHDFPKPSAGVSPFVVNGDGVTTVPEEGAIKCMGETSADEEPSNNGTVLSGEEQRFQFSWGDPAVCTEFSVYKFYSLTSDLDMIVNGVDVDPNGDGCPVGSVCTVIQSRGYNVACTKITSGSHVVEREYTQVY